MNNIDKAYKEVKTLGEFSREYFSYLLKVLNNIDANEINKLGDIFEVLETSKNLKLIGISCHVGSQIFNTNVFS